MRGLLIAILVAAVGLAYVLVEDPFGFRAGQPPAQEGARASNQAAPSSSPAGSAATSPQLASREAPPGDRPAARVQAPTTIPPASPAPTFDVVRVTPSGDAVIAGRAAPGAEVTVKDSDVTVGKVTADRRGEWVLVPDKPLPSGARELSLEAQSPGKEAVESKEVVILHVPENKQGGQARGEALAVLTPRRGLGASKVLQGPVAPAAAGGQAPPKGDAVAETSAAGGLRLDIIDYDQQGNVVLSGRSAPGERVRALADDEVIGSAVADSAGSWHIVPERPVPPGRHRLRIEQIDSQGHITAMLTLPFRRAVAAAQPRAGGHVVVQPGNSLWRIARSTYGSGFKYTLIFTANANQIGDPDLIFPGQIFILPVRN